jgi:hypothetical protein
MEAVMAYTWDDYWADQALSHSDKILSILTAGKYVRDSLVEERLKSLPVVERLKGLSIEDRLQGLKPRDVLKAIPEKEIEAYLNKLRKRKPKSKK